MPSNRASWLMTKQATAVVATAPYTSPSSNELVIRTRAVAINPADVIIQKSDVLLTKYPAILGCDVAGEVVEVDPSLADTFKIGDRVIGASSPLFGYSYSGFQEYVVLKAPSIAKIPNACRYEDAVVLPLGINTAASCLFAKETLGLDLSRSGAEAGTVLVWGASSSVGACAVQMAALAGYDVVGVASAANHEMVKGLGASACFDYHVPDVVEQLVAHLKGKQIVGAVLSVDTNLDPICEIVSRSQGTKLVVSVIPGADQKGSHGVRVTTNFASVGQLQSDIWRWLQNAMDAGKIKYAPPAEVVGKGLESIQAAIDQLAAGVSAKKLVVSI